MEFRMGFPVENILVIPAEDLDTDSDDTEDEAEHAHENEHEHQPDAVPEIPTIKLLIVGDSGTGKTTFMGRHVAEMERFNEARVTRLEISSNCGTFAFACWDNDSGMNPAFFERHCIASRCVIIMFDVTARSTYRNLSIWRSFLRRHVDAANRRVRPRAITFHRRNNLQYYEISALSNYNLDKPFLYLARQIFGNDDLQFNPAPILLPPEVQLDLAAQELNETELALAAEQPLPDRD